MTLRSGIRNVLQASGIGYGQTTELYTQLDTFDTQLTALETNSPTPVAVTATSDGLTTGLIPATAQYVTAASGNSAHIVTLPAPIVGHQVRVYVGTTACMVRTVASSNVKLNGTDADGTNSGTLLASGLHIFTCVTATGWLGVSISSAGVTAAIAVA